MSKLKISPNLFLEVNELNRLVQFLSEDGYKPLLKYLIKSFGIVQNNDNTYFKVSQKNGTQNVIIINSGIAFDENLNRIFLSSDKELEVTNTGNTQWVLISYTSTNNEEGIVNISAQGALSGIGTKFTSVLRGQPNFPTKVKLTSSINTDEYEVVDVTSDTIATLVGSFVAEQGLKYQVIGTFTPGFQPNDEDKAIYEYDSCRIDIVESENRPELTDGQFIIAKISYLNNSINIISDERVRNLFNCDNKVDEDINTNTSQNNPLVALKQTTIRNERMLNIQIEWGHIINKFEYHSSIGKEDDLFKIISGNSAYIPLNSIPDGIFKNWLLVNRENMVSVVIDDNKNNSLYITQFDPLILTDENDFVIVPNFKEIEFEVTLNKDNNKLKYFFKFSIENEISNFYLPIEYGQTLVGIRYRMISLNKTTKFKNFPNVRFVNVEGNEENLINSSFIININKPEEVQRNYS